MLPECPLYLAACSRESGSLQPRVSGSRVARAPVDNVLAANVVWLLGKRDAGIAILNT